MSTTASLWLMMAALLPPAGAHAGAVERAVERVVVTEFSADRPQRVLVVGASSIEYYVGAALERRLEAHRGVQVDRIGRLGTGLSRPDVHDWPKELAQVIPRKKPDLVIAQFGGNDAQTLEVGRRKEHRVFGTDGWDEEYARRVTRVVEIAREGGARVIIMGSPVMRSPAFSRRIERINRVTRQAAIAAGATYFSTWELLADDEGAYVSRLEHDGKRETPRLADGIHLSSHGASYLTQRIDWWLQRHFRFVPRDPALAEALRIDFRSQMLDRRVSYLAFVPQGLGRGERLPVLYLLHGKGGSFEDWPSHAHEMLQTLATRHRMILVAPDATEDGWYLESARIAGGRAETYLLEELLPHVEGHLPTSGVRAIAGVAMGGHGALSLAVKYPGVFASASAMGGAVDLTQLARDPALVARLGPYAEEASLWHRHSVMHLIEAHPQRSREVPILLSTGEGDRFREANRALQALLGRLGGPHAFDDTLTSSDWDAWVRTLPRHVSWHAAQLGTSAPPGPRTASGAGGP